MKKIVRLLSTMSNLVQIEVCIGFEEPLRTIFTQLVGILKLHATKRCIYISKLQSMNRCMQLLRKGTILDILEVHDSL